MKGAHMVRKILVAALFAALIAGGLAIGANDKGKPEGEIMTGLKNGTVEQAFGKKSYFGHQSVGRDILNGVALLVPTHVDRIISLDPNGSNSFEERGIYHSRVGANADPKRKIDAFRDVLHSVSPGTFDVAFLKFCYVDVTEKTDIDDLYAYYRETLAALKLEFPDVIFVHFTVPLTTTSETWKTSLKKLLGKDIWEYADNVQRNRFNDLIREEYLGKEPVFDLAAVESTLPDGSRASFSLKGTEFYSLAESYTRDGGHLNENGSKVVAAALLEMLAAL